MHTTNYKTNKGFTLIELLVVISIIGIFSSVVLASVTSAKDKAKLARYQSDLHQVEIFLELYQAEYGGYPAGTPGTLYCIADSSATQQCMIGNSSVGIVNISTIPTITALINTPSNNIENLAAVAAPKLKNDITLGTGSSSYRGILYRPCDTPTLVGTVNVCIVTNPLSTNNPTIIYPNSSTGSIVVKSKVVGTNTVNNYVAP